VNGTHLVFQYSHSSTSIMALNFPGRVLTRLPSTPVLTVSVRQLNANRSAVTRTKREVFLRKYPTLTVLPNGATITVKYHEPRQIIKLPVKFEECSVEKQKYIRLLRQPKTAKDDVKEINSTFDPRKYL